eukprot:Gb_35662 [translate_table: standard]
MVSVGLLVLSAYHMWLIYRVINYPFTTILGINAINRRVWVESMMAVSPLLLLSLSHSVGNLDMASTMLVSMVITLCSLIGVLVSNKGRGYNGSVASQAILFGD